MDGKIVNEKLVQAMLSFGEKYYEEELRKYGEGVQLCEQWWQALKFFFDRAFLQGRRDEISFRVRDAAIAVLEPELSGVNTSLDDAHLKILEARLREKIGKGKIGKEQDVQMTVSALRYVFGLPNLNIVAHSIECIKERKVEEHYKGLQNKRSKNKAGIIGVADKIASFYLRDIVSLFRLETQVPEDHQYCLQPVDVWVREFAIISDIAKSRRDNLTTMKQIRDGILRICREHHCSPVQFNQGVWYAGSHAFKLLFLNVAEYGV